VAHGKSADECRAKINAAKIAIRERMGEQVFGEEDDELEHVVVRMTNERGVSFATAEIGTGGLLARRITEVAGQETCYRGGVIGPSIEVLTSLLGPQAKPVSPPSKSEEHAQITTLCQRCREKFAADFVLFVGPFARYDREDATQAAPVSHAALVGKDVLRIVDFTFLGDKTLDKSRAAKIALNLLRLHFLRGDNPDEQVR
jgi:nicotinamide-nucleotide amidase